MPVRILIVDDHEGIREMVRRLLECRDDFEVCGEAEDGAQGVDKSAELQPDVVVMNLAMPVMNGLDAACQIRTISPNSRVVILTSHADKELMDEASKVGVICYLLKSNVGRDLVNAIVTAVDGQSSVL